MPISAEDIREAMLSSGKTTIETDSYGSIELRGLTGKDMEWFQEEKVKALPARDFTVHLVQMHLVSPSFDIDTVEQWQDKFLSFVACGWWKEQGSSENLPSNTFSFEAFHKMVYEYTEKWKRDFEELGKNFLPPLISPDLVGFAVSNLATSTISPILDALQSSMATNVFPILDGLQKIAETNVTMVNLIFKQQLAPFTNLITDILKDTIKQISLPSSIIPQIDTSHIFAALPDFIEIDEICNEVLQGEESFRQAGYGFIFNNISAKFILQFTSVNQRVRHAVITNELVRITRGKKFKEDIHRIFQQSSMLHNRWKIVEQALAAHRRREYYLSVPALFSQVEGIIGDLLILKKLVYRKGHKLYRIDINGNRLKGKSAELRGFDNLINHSKLNHDTRLKNAANLITSQLAGDRNGIFHGRRTDYGKAKFSVQGLLLILIFAEALHDFENSYK